MSKLVSILFAASLGLASTASHAMPIPFVGQIGQADTVIQVAGGCGRGWHRGPFGGCLKNFANPAAHACPRGYHIGPGGRCRGNGR